MYKLFGCICVIIIFGICHVRSSEIPFEEDTKHEPTSVLDNTISNVIESIDKFYALVHSEEFLKLRKTSFIDAKNEESLELAQHGKKLIALCREFEADPEGNLEKYKIDFIQKISGLKKLSYEDFLKNTFYAAFLSNKIAHTWSHADFVHQRATSLLEELQNNNYDYFVFCQELHNIIGPMAEAACGNEFYPLVLIGNNGFQKEAYLYALSKGIILLSIPSRICEGIHGGVYRTCYEILLHDVAHFSQMEDTREGILPFFYDTSEGLKDNDLKRKYNIYNEIGKYFHGLLQPLAPDSLEYKRIREIGFNLTHETWTRKDTFPESSHTVKDYLKDLIGCLKTNLENDYLPDSLVSEEAFIEALPKSMEIKNQLTRQSSAASSQNSRGFRRFRNKAETLLPTNIDEIKFEIRSIESEKSRIRIKYLMHFTHNETSMSQEGKLDENVSYKLSKTNRSDWIKSLEVAGYDVKDIYEGESKTLNYNPILARKMHFSMLDWFAQTYLK